MSLDTPETTLELARWIRQSTAPVALWVGADRIASATYERAAAGLVGLEAEVRRAAARGIGARCAPPGTAPHTLLPIRDAAGHAIATLDLVEPIHGSEETYRELFESLDEGVNV